MRGGGSERGVAAVVVGEVMVVRSSGSERGDDSERQLQTV